MKTGLSGAPVTSRRLLPPNLTARLSRSARQAVLSWVCAVDAGYREIALSPSSNVYRRGGNVPCADSRSLPSPALGKRRCARRRGGVAARGARRIGVLMAVAADSEGQALHTAFVQGLQELGWSDGRNVRLDTRWGAGNTDRVREYATELVALA